MSFLIPSQGLYKACWGWLGLCSRLLLLSSTQSTQARETETWAGPKEAHARLYERVIGKLFILRAIASFTLMTKLIPRSTFVDELTLITRLKRLRQVVSCYWLQLCWSKWWDERCIDQFSSYSFVDLPATTSFSRLNGQIEKFIGEVWNLEVLSLKWTVVTRPYTCDHVDYGLKKTHAMLSDLTP